MEIDQEGPLQSKISLENVEQLIAKRSSSRSPVFPKLDSKLCISIVLGYAFTWDRATLFFHLVSKKGRAYFEKESAQLRHFINNETIKSMQLAFGNRSFQFIRPERFSRIGKLEFAYVTSDLFTIEDFAQQTLQIDNLEIGNRNIKLFEDDKLDEMIGLTLPFPVICKPTDRQNLSALVHLLKRTRMLKLNRLTSTWPILKILSKNESAFPNINGIHLEFDPIYADLIQGLPDNLLKRCRKLSLDMGNVMPNDPNMFLQIAYELIEKTEHLETLELRPTRRDVKWIEMLVACAPKLKQLQCLSISCCLANIDNQGNYKPVEQQEQEEESKQQPSTHDDMPIRGVQLHSKGEIDYMMTSNYVQVMAPERIAAKQAQIVHEEFMRYEQVFRESFPLLRKLRIEMGQLMLATTNLFPNVNHLSIQAALTPNSGDLLSEEQLRNLQTIKFEKMPLCADKVAKLLKQLTFGVSKDEGAPETRPKFKKIQIHTDALPPRFYQDFLSQCQVQQLQLTQVHLIEGLKYLAPLAENKSIKELTLVFYKFIHKTPDTDFLFPKAKNMSLKKLILHCPQTTSVGNIFSNDGLVLQWKSFYEMFGALESFQLTHASLPKSQVADLFSGLILNKHLKSFVLKKSNLPTECLKNIFESAALPSPDCVLETLGFELVGIDEALISSHAIPMLKNTQTLRSFQISQQKFKELDSLLQLMEVVQNHPTLEELNLQNLNVPIKFNEHLDALYRGIIEMTRGQSKLQKIVIC